MPTRYDKKDKYFTEKVIKDNIKVIIHTLVDKLSGYLHVHPDERLKDELNKSSRNRLPQRLMSSFNNHDSLTAVKK